MSVVVEKTSSLGRRIVVEVPVNEVVNAENSSLKDLAKNLKIDGFRAGKVPANYIKQHYGKRIRGEAISKVIETSLSNVLKEQNLRPANRPNIEDIKDNEGQNLSYTVSFEIFPEINPDFKAIELEKPVAEITEQDIQNGIKKLQDQFSTWDEVERAAENGDQVVIDFVGRIDGEEFAGGSAQDTSLELGADRFIPGFEQGLVGAKAGEEKVLKLKFPADYHSKDLADKDCEFSVTVKKVQAKSLAPVDEAFAEKIGIEDKDVAKISDKIKENMAKYAEDLVNGRLRDLAFERLYETNKLELPKSLLEQEKHSLLHEKHGDKNASCEQAHGKELSEEENVELEQQATKRLTLGLLVNEIITKNKLEPEQDRILAKMHSMSLMYGANNDFMQKMYYESKEIHNHINSMVLSEQVADLIVKNATIKEVKSSFDEIVNAKK